MKRFALGAVVASLLSSAAMAASDITGVVTEVEGYWDAVVPISIGILLFVIGRRVVKKL